jgi:hypothetical protein
MRDERDTLPEDDIDRLGLDVRALVPWPICLSRRLLGPGVAKVGVANVGVGVGVAREELILRDRLDSIFLSHHISRTSYMNEINRSQRQIYYSSRISTLIFVD